MGNHKHPLDDIISKQFPMREIINAQNENVIFQKGHIPCIGHEKYIDLIEQKILHTSGGAYLVTGFKEVGKSTIVHNAIYRLKTEKPGKVFDVKSSFTPEKNYSNILRELAVGLCSVIGDSPIWDMLPQKIQNRISNISERSTKHGIKEHSTRTAETGGSFGASGFMNASVNAKTSKSNGVEAILDDLDASGIESELKQVVAEIQRFDPETRFVFTIDEIDKLTQNTDGKKDFETFLNRAKSVLCGMNVVFILIVGIDIYEEWEHKHNHAESLYRSVFRNPIYIPCVWDHATALFSLIKNKRAVFKSVPVLYRDYVKRQTVEELRVPFDWIDRYLIFKGRGEPGIILKTFFEFLDSSYNAQFFQVKKEQAIDVKHINSLYTKFQIYQDLYQDKNWTDPDFKRYERDAHYMLFLLLIEYLIKMKGIDFTEADATNAILEEKDIGDTTLNRAIPELISALIDTNIIIPQRSHKKRGAKQESYTVVDATICSIKARQATEAVFTRKKSEWTENYTEQQFRNTINASNSKDILDFWSEYHLTKLYSRTEQKAICAVKSIRTNTIRVATIYDRSKSIDATVQDRLQSLLHGSASRSYASPLFFDTEVLLLNGEVHSLIQTPVQGILLSDLVTAGLKEEVIYEIARQLSALSSEMAKQNRICLSFSPDNIIICKDGSVMIPSFLNLLRQSQDIGRLAADETEVPEETAARTNIYSIGLLLLYMVSDGKLDYGSETTAVDVLRLLQSGTQSEKLKKLIAKMTDSDPTERPFFDKRYHDALRKCPEFKHCGTLSLLKTGKKRVTIIAYEEASPSFLNEPLQETVLLSEQTLFDSVESSKAAEYASYSETQILSTKYQMIPPGVSAQLINKRTNEEVSIRFSPFTIGRRGADYCLSDALVSNLHTQIFFNENKFQLVDLSSDNGTFVDNVKIGKDSVVLKNSSVIRLGSTELVVIIQSG